MIKVLLADDQKMVRQGIRMMIEETGEFSVTAEADTGREAVMQGKTADVDIAVLDVRMPEMTGLAACRELIELFPELPVLILTTFDDDAYAIEALENGAKGFMLKDADASKLITAMKKALEGGITIDEGVAGRIIPDLMKKEKPPQTNISLTKRERDITILIGEGRTNQEIASELFLSVGTVKNHISVILDKLELRDRTQLAIFAIRQNLV
ncbi:response regulator transcription factor [Salisediminibacterium halotolerans]|uniref:DNA-binding response regulator, NarL/FixJ family, contains REC and HTH domains n=1 Tax=Salisediminibacterium halotolerans TaxID=517425 RepID=A0A1H9SZX4_9BACI|nr:MULTISPECIES: response regulator transcription factor [Salisediminibacterium]RLJ72266.1 LuxR family two component transcriptional regulator [Actinophytocola xinjiangensis]RPE85480.1 LuxR family two component transcriptional regulator [Salisediminibacterium halotolerans]TWG33435.1 LuxR family two component transcriptional regulator [Salisediminibacterium halotolerans]SER89923.1 DNA-binding response regulator, NarL/FixJ family, contains REC and HTH domains [Salisediminibacterium haloalkalitole